MTIGFMLEDHEKEVNALNTAQAIINSEEFTVKQLKEIIAYLSVYTRYNPDK